MLATTAFHTICPFTFSLLCSSSCISFLVFLSSSPFLMVFLPSAYLLPSLSSLPLLLYHHHIFLHHVLPTFPPLLFSFTPFSFSVPSLLLLFLFLHPFSSPCPSSHLFFNHVLQIPPSLIHFLHPISPPPHYVLPFLLLLIPLLLILLPPRSLLFFSLISPLTPFLTFLLVPSSSPSFISTPFCCLNLGLSIWSINLRNR